jgi:hypothetical protein
MLHYDNPGCSTVEDFNDDLQKVIHIKKLVSKDFNKRLLLNHIIVLLNTFETKAAVTMLFYKIDEKYWPIIKTYFEFLSVMPDVVEDLNILSSDIPLDSETIQELRAL